MRHNDQLIESNKCHLELDLAIQIGRKQLQQLKPVAHGRPVYF